MADGIHTPCNVARSWHWFRQVTTPCNMACGSGIVTVNSPSNSTRHCDTWFWDDTCHWIRPNVRHIGFLRLVSISTTSPQSTCPSTSVSEILSKSDHHPQKKMTSCWFSRWRISAILDFRHQIMGSLRSPCTTSYRSSIETIALNCLVFEKIAFFWLFGDRQTFFYGIMTRPSLSDSKSAEHHLNFPVFFS